MNEIEIMKQQKNSIDFMKEWIEQPEIFKEYIIHYQNKEYSVIAEVLFALLMYQIKKKIEKDYIIAETIYELPTENKFFINRFTISLESIGFKGIEVEENEYKAYKIQGDNLHEIIDNYNDYLRWKLIIQNRTTLQIDNSIPFTEREYNILIRQFSFQERSQMKLTQLDNYCIFLASKYFDTIDDHINLTKVCKRLKLNMEKFHFNPIPLTETTREYFPYLQTLYQYNSDDNLFESDKRIIARKNIYLLKYHSQNQIETSKQKYFN